MIHIAHLEFDRDGRQVAPAEPAATRDILFMAHGWMSGFDDSAALFGRIRRPLLRRHDHLDLTLCEVYWPSLAFAPASQTPGAAAGLVSGLKGLINLPFYATMKNRAGDIGRRGLAPFLEFHHRQSPGTRIHLAGHSFGARLVTAAAQAACCPIASLTLLQAAFSQFAFAPSGAFRDLVTRRKVQGPILITHSRRDLAVGAAYPAASFALRQNASFLGGKDDPYGGLGRNGAQGLLPGECVQLQLGELDFDRPEPVLNLDGNDIIAGHSDLGHPEIAATLAAVIRRSCPSETGPRSRRS
jgi:pimeloyl-ACP methyl ester carboxylesterase